MSRLRTSLETGTFVVTAEIAPPKGVDLAPSLELARTLAGQVTAVNVTDNQGANLRMSPLALAILMAQQEIEPVLQLTCRDRNRLALQSDLLGAAAGGVENLLLLSGDHSSFGDHPDAKPVFDLDSVQLIQVAHNLNRGLDMNGNQVDPAPTFFCGGAVAPAADPFELMFQKFAKKAAAGADFFQTQAIFDITRIAEFMQAAKEIGKPVILGVLLLKSPKMARFLNANIPGVRVPEPIIERLEQASSPLQEGIAIARELVAAAREHCQGVHLMTLGREDLIPTLLT